MPYDAIATARPDQLRSCFRKGRAPWLIRDGKMGFLRVGGAETDLDRAVDRRAFSTLMRERHAALLHYQATRSLADQQPEESALYAFKRNRSPQAAQYCFGALLIFTLAVAPAIAIAAAVLIASASFLAIAIFRVALAIIARNGVRPAARKPLGDEDLPTVTILAPLYREAHALPGLMRSLLNLDYPAEKLDIKLLLEEDDLETRNEAFRIAPDDRFDVIVIPPSFPRTKPKACNYGLACARGDLIVIYDAEDEPDARQLRCAAEIFAAADDALACVQARLNYYNPEENWLTRLFTLEYCLWFDHFLPALDRLGAPVPLGGTSNIFRTEILAEAGGWDPHNVTEDADLGLRLARRGYRTAVIDSTTLEEANCRVGNWMRQRSRWMKGFMQTWLVHRCNQRGLNDWRSIVAVDLLIGGTALAALANPILWAALLAERMFGFSLLAPLPDALRHATTAALIFGNLSFLALAAYAPIARGLACLSPAALMTPFYWLMMSAAAWKALWQLARRPSYWEKTEHGLSSAADARRAAALEAIGLESKRPSRQIQIRELNAADGRPMSEGSCLNEPRRPPLSKNERPRQ